MKEGHLWVKQTPLIVSSHQWGITSDLKGVFLLAKSINEYGLLVETLHLEDGTTPKVGFREGKWLAGTEDEKVAVSKKGYLLHLDYDEKGQAVDYKLYLNFAEMAADDVDYLLLAKVATALGNKDYVLFLD
jgi:hypothetical protein